MLRFLIILATLVIFAAVANTVYANSMSSKRSGLLIFVSLSMPDQLLVKLDALSKKAGGKLILRGLKNNSFKETFAHIQSLGIAADIDPQAFEQFDVQLVPAFVVSEGLIHDKITGNVSLQYALEQFAEHGSLASEAKKYLRGLGNAEVN